MKQIRNFEILFTLLLARALAIEDVDPIFKAIGDTLEMGFCFGDDIAVYKQTSEGRELLGQASTPEVSPPAAFVGRVNVSDELKELLGMKITNLQFSDSGVYIRECWSQRNMEHKHTIYLYVCEEEIGSKEVSLTAKTGADLHCQADSGSQATVKWYRDLDNITLFMDTSVSLEPLQSEFKGLIQVIDGGSSLHVSDEFIENRPSFICQVMDGGQCRRFQSIRLPAEPEMKIVYRSVGEKLVLNCSVNILRKSFWTTPSGWNYTTQLNETSGDYSLVIPSLAQEDSGSFKCFSTFLVEEYFISLCPFFQSSEVTFTTGQEKVVLDCDLMSLPTIGYISQHTSIQWYRKSGKDDALLFDSGDPLTMLPQDLQGRVDFNVNNSLVLTNPKPDDSRMYWCVVLLNPEPIYEYEDDENEEEGEELEDEEDKHFSFQSEDEDFEMCLSRQAITLNFVDKNIRKLDIPPPTQTYSEPRNETTAQPEPETNITKIAVCVGIAALLVLLSIGVAVFLKMRGKKNDAKGRDLQLSEEEGKPLRV